MSGQIELLNLSIEVLYCILRYLYLIDIKHIMLCSKYLYNVIKLDINNPQSYFIKANLLICNGYAKYTDYIEEYECIMISQNYHIKHGYYRAYHKTPSDKLKYAGQYKLNNRHGLYQTFHVSGQLASEVIYVDDLRQGLYKAYYANGNLAHKVNYIDGLARGLCLYYHNNGNISRQLYYKDSHPYGKAVLYDTDGIIIEEITYAYTKHPVYLLRNTISATGIKHGITRIYHVKLNTEFNFMYGAIKEIATYINNYRDGICKIYYPSGNLHIEHMYKHGRLHGFTKTYRDNIMCEIECIQEYKYGREFKPKK